MNRRSFLGRIGVGVATAVGVLAGNSAKVRRGDWQAVWAERQQHVPPVWTRESAIPLLEAHYHQVGRERIDQMRNPCFRVGSRLWDVYYEDLVWDQRFVAVGRGEYFALQFRGIPVVADKLLDTMAVRLVDGRAIGLFSRRGVG
jgi:hypothetical protein